MKTFFLSAEEQGIVVFHLWKSLAYKSRMILSLSLILAGFVLQYLVLDMYNSGSYIFLGICLVFFGNLFMVVKGYNNNISLAAYTPDHEWAKVESDQLDKILEINRKSKQWDINGLDITNVLGVFVFIGIIIFLLVFNASGVLLTKTARHIFAFNLLALLGPHWFTGVRRITTMPKLVNKINIYKNLMAVSKNLVREDDVNYLVYVEGSDKKMPKDVKMKIDFKDQPEEFLGLYAQISLNNVNNQDYPYFYVVLVAKATSGILKKQQHTLQLPDKVIKEYKVEKDVEILVIRQYTTKTSGYHTKSKAIEIIFNTGVDLAHSIITKYKAR
ncbi:MAG: hypothetical protein JXB49_23305 [Bacteroidales bacterium]|nr:hypothetical protein [Bacteroidales bacterium]